MLKVVGGTGERALTGHNSEHGMARVCVELSHAGGEEELGQRSLGELVKFLHCRSKS